MDVSVAVRAHLEEVGSGHSSSVSGSQSAGGLVHLVHVHISIVETGASESDSEVIGIPESTVVCAEDNDEVSLENWGVGGGTE